jgi:hypothetical protein
MQFERGVRDAFQDTLEGMVAGVLIQVTLTILKTMPDVPSYYASLIQLIEVLLLIGSIFVVFQIETWRFMYLLGWILAMWFLDYAGLVEHWLFIVYACVGIPTLIIRIFKEITKE